MTVQVPAGAKIVTHVVVRADGSASMGLGHVARMATLAEAFGAAGVAVTFAVHHECRIALDVLAARGLRAEVVRAPSGATEDALQTRSIASSLKATLILVDGYQFDPAYLGVLHDAGLCVCYVDDMFRPCGGADALLNNNVNADRASFTYALPPTALLGPHYALLGDAFARARRSINASSATRVLVTLGGSDPARQTEKVIASLALLSPSRTPLSVRVIVGAATTVERLREIEVAAQACPRHDIRVEHGVSDMATRMAAADLAVTAGGTTCLELCCVGVPALVIAVADNQRGIAEGLGRMGLMVFLGWHEDVTASAIANALDALSGDVPRRVDMVKAQHQAVDGKGKERVVAALLDAHARFTSTSHGAS